MNNLYSNDQLTKLYEKTYSSVYAVAYSIVKNEQDACDLTQDTYVSAFTNIDKLNDIEKFDKWVIQIVANKCKDFLRKNKPTLFSQMGEEEENFEADIPDSSDAYYPDAAVESKETKDIIKDILYSLPEDQRLCLILYYGQDLKISEIAKTLGVSENTVKSRLAYGKKKMKERIEELEKNGTKLHGIALIGFLPLIRQLFASGSFASAPGGTISAAIPLTKSARSASSAATNTVKKATTSAAGKLTKKIVAAVAAATVAATGAAVVINSDLFSNDEGSSPSSKKQNIEEIDDNKEIDLFENAIIEFEGYSGKGKLRPSLRTDIPNNAWDEYILFSVEEDGTLSNGDKVTVIAKIENYKEKEYELEDGYTIPQSQEKTFTVKDLKVLMTKEEIEEGYIEELKNRAIEEVGVGQSIGNVFVFFGESKGAASNNTAVFAVVSFTNIIGGYSHTTIFFNCYKTELRGTTQFVYSDDDWHADYEFKETEAEAFEYIKELYPDYKIVPMN